MSHGIDINLLPESMRQGVADLIAAFEGSQLENKLLREHLRLALIKKYGPKSESLSDAQLELLELEPGVEQAEVVQESEQSQQTKDQTPRDTPKTRKPSHGRSPLPPHLPRKVVTVPVPETLCVCERCQAPKDLIGYEESEQLHVIPAEYCVLVTRREKRACRRCSEQGVQTAALPERILPKGKLSDEFIIDVLVRKYLHHTPVYRQCASLEQDHGIRISRQTLVDALMASGNLMQALVKPLKADLLAGGYIQADETTVPVQSAAVRGRNHRGYLWQYGRPGGPVVFDFQMGRSREGPKTLLQGFQGWLQSDGYSAYAQLGEGIRHAGCLVHARRYYFEAAQLSPTAPEPREMLGLFAQIYAVEEEAREAGLLPPARLELRQARSRPLMETLKRRASEIHKAALPSSKIGEACAYTLSQWERLEQFLNDGILEADNNLCENGMRPIALGRKNWLHLGDESAGPKVAAILSVFETCRRLKINVREYLTDVLPKLGAWPANRVGELCPTAWKASRTV